MLIHYLVKDEPETERFQSGLFNVSDRAKLAALAFPLPLAQAGRSGGASSSGAKSGRARACRRTASRCARAAPGASAAACGRTGTRGFFSTKVAAPPGASVRIYSPRDNAYSAPSAFSTACRLNWLRKPRIRSRGSGAREDP